MSILILRKVSINLNDLNINYVHILISPKTNNNKYRKIFKRKVTNINAMPATGITVVIRLVHLMLELPSMLPSLHVFPGNIRVVLKCTDVINKDFISVS